MENLFGRLLRAIRLRSAIKHANKLQQLTGKRHYVIQVFNKLRVYDRKRIDLLIRRGVLHKRLLNYIELEKTCLYVTPNRK